MNCKTFKKYIYDYLIDLNFDWKLRYEMQDHLLECETCQKVYTLASLVTNKELLSKPIQRVKFEIFMENAEKLMLEGKYKKALKYLERGNEIHHGDETVGKMMNEARNSLEAFSLINKILRNIEKLNKLISKNTLSFNLYSLEASRSDTYKDVMFKMGERVIINIDAPQDRDGYLTVLYYDEKPNIKLIFPNKKDDNNFIEKSVNKKLGIRITGPIGKQYLRVIWTESQLFKVDEIQFFDKLNVLKNIEIFFDILSMQGRKSWMEQFTEYSVYN